jgi:hypothetical protein
MNAVPFAMLKFARKLEASGMAPGTAAGTAEALAEAMSGAELATRSGLAGVQGDIEGLRTEFKRDIDGLRTELKADMAILIRDLIIQLRGMMVIGFGVVPGAMRYLLVHP